MSGILRVERRWYTLRKDKEAISIHIPKEVAQVLGWEVGDQVQLRCRSGKLTVDKEMTSESGPKGRARREGYNGHLDARGDAGSDSSSATREIERWIREQSFED